MPINWKYEVQVKSLNKAIKVPKELTQKLKGILSSKMISRMKKEGINCPVLGKQISFLQCYNCPNFIRRIRGVVHCKGAPIKGL